MSKTPNKQSLSECELEKKLHQLVLPLEGLDKKNKPCYVSNEENKSMNDSLVKRAEELANLVNELEGDWPPSNRRKLMDLAAVLRQLANAIRGVTNGHD